MRDGRLARDASEDGAAAGGTCERDRARPPWFGLAWPAPGRMPWWTPHTVSDAAIAVLIVAAYPRTVTVVVALLFFAGNWAQAFLLEARHEGRRRAGKAELLVIEGGSEGQDVLDRLAAVEAWQDDYEAAWSTTSPGPAGPPPLGWPCNAIRDSSASRLAR